MGYILKRLLQPSCWAGIAGVFAAIGQIAASGINGNDVGVLLTALVAIFLPSKQLVERFPPQEKTEAEEQPPFPSIFPNAKR